uniref:C-type lectin domain-containing protein n=1 Tax=Gadus morhua TaxID=8049 RepID=A0A8C5CJ54_GADMO
IIKTSHWRRPITLVLSTTLSGSNIVFIPKIKSWWDAQSYCRKHHTDLPSIRNLEENSLVYQIHNLQAWKWIGLHRNLRSTWSDGSNSSYRNWKDNIPPTRPAWTENNCTVALSNNGWQWADKQCNSKFNFLCNGGKICSILFQNVCSLTWSDAQSHCRQYGGDLATVHGPENQTRLVEVARKYNSHVWIGLYDDVESWTWSLSENANYSGGEVEPWSWPWRGHQPNNWEATEGCIAINRTTWLDANCNNQYSFSCFDNDTKGEALVEALSWWDAQSYCREHHTDLPSIRNIEENKMVSNMNAPTLIKWIGLHRNLWSTWSDGSDTSYRDWKAGMPKNSHGTMTNCALAQTDYGWQWSDYPCQNKYKFICSVGKICA